MISKTMQDAVNKQINSELFSAYLYLAMGAFFREKSLNGMANWMECQALEEQYHAMKMYGFVNERGGRVFLKPIAEPPAVWDSPLAVFQAVAEHEAKITGLINGLVDLAIQEKDHATNNFLQWFVTEQVEEEATADEVIQKMKLIESHPGGLFMMDQELGQRVFNLPPEATNIAAGAGA